MDSSESNLASIYPRYFIMESVNGGTLRQLITTLVDGKGGTLVENWWNSRAESSHLVDHVGPSPPISISPSVWTGLIWSRSISYEMGLDEVIIPQIPLLIWLKWPRSGWITPFIAAKKDMGTAVSGPRISEGYVAELLHQALYALRHLHHDSWQINHSGHSGGSGGIPWYPIRKRWNDLKWAREKIWHANLGCDIFLLEELGALVECSWYSLTVYLYTLAFQCSSGSAIAICRSLLRFLRNRVSTRTWN